MTDNDTLFTDSHAAAQSQKSRWTRLASSWRSIRVTLTPEILTVIPRPLVKWLTILLALDLCHRIPVGHIRKVRDLGEESGYGKVEVVIQTQEGREKNLLLWLKDTQAFIEATKGLIEQADTQRQ